MKNATGSSKLAGMASAALALMASIGAFNGLTAGPAPVARKASKRNGRGKPGSYGRGLRNAITSKGAARMAKLHKLQDEHGAFTLTGSELFTTVMRDGLLVTADGQQRYGSRNRRMWLAGISAQRGF